MSEVKPGNLFRTLSRARLWVALQFGLTLLLILLGVAWTRLPDKHFWQVVLLLLAPFFLTISALELQAGTVRAFARDDGRRVKLVWGAITLLVWIAIGWAAWALLDWCDDQIPLWAGSLNSRASAQATATLFTYQHIVRWLTMLEWFLRWIAVPAKLIPWAAASAQWGLRLPWGRIVRGGRPHTRPARREAGGLLSALAAGGALCRQASAPLALLAEPLLALGSRRVTLFAFALRWF